MTNLPFRGSAPHAWEEAIHLLNSALETAGDSGRGTADAMSIQPGIEVVLPAIALAVEQDVHRRVIGDVRQLHVDCIPGKEGAGRGERRVGGTLSVHRDVDAGGSLVV